MANNFCEHRWRYIHGVIVAYSTAGTMRDEDWNAMVHDLKTVEPFRGYLGSSTGAVQVSSVQRKAGVDAMAARGKPTSIVSESRIVIGLVTAASWLGARIKAFPWSDLEGAVRFLEVPEDDIKEVVDAILQMKTETGD